MAPDCRAAGENQMIERQVGEGSSNIRTAGDNGELGLVKITGHQPLHEGRCYWRQLRGFQQGPVAGTQNVDDGAEGQLIREVPGTEDADDAFGLEFDASRGA